MVSFLILGMVIGMAHALEADHLAAVGTLAVAGKASPKRLAFLGVSWGMGHTTTLLLLSVPVVLFGVVLSARLAAGMELFVGLMLAALGAQVLWKIRSNPVHFHVHDHSDGQKHLHSHSHSHSHSHGLAGVGAPHRKQAHDYAHVRFSPRAYLIGLSHGAAGSAGLVALAAAATKDVSTAIAYVLVFGVGSIVGMAVLTYGVSWPLRIAENSAAWLLKTVQIAVASMAIFIGSRLVLKTAPILWGAV